MRDVLKPMVTLFVIAGIAAAILGYVNAVTEAPIADAELQATKDSVKAVFPEVAELTESDIITVDDNSTDVTQYITAKNTNGEVLGYAVFTESNGFSAGLKLMFGVDADGKITGVSVVDCSNETPGLGANVAVKDDFRNQFVGKDGDIAVTKDGGDIDALTGATITSRAVAKAANSAIEYYNSDIKGGVN